jgi:hypothetical protein
LCFFTKYTDCAAHRCSSVAVYLTVSPNNTITMFLCTCRYILGIFWRLRGRKKLQLVALFGAAAVSKRAYAKARRIFLARINAGGLLLLNELLLQYGGAEIARLALEYCQKHK